MGPSGRPGGHFDLQRAGRIPDRRCDPRYHCRPARPPRHPARRPVDHQHLHPADRDVGGFVSVVLVLRILTGIGLGVLLPLATTYINELAPRRVANTFALWGVALGWALGGTLAGVAGVFATPVFGWTALYWLGSLAFLLLPFMHFILPG